MRTCTLRTTILCLAVFAAIIVLNTDHCQAGADPGATPLSLITDASGMFNERGYLKANSYSVDANEVINDFNGNLTWVQNLQYLPLSQNEFFG